MRNKLSKIFMVVVFMIFSFCLYSQVFPPPENVDVDPYFGLVTWDPPLGMIYSDDFESYNVGEYLAVQSDDWTTWSNNPGSAEDAFISEEQALSGTQSVKIDGSSDVVLIMNNYTSGCYSMDLNMYIVSGNTAHFNLQKTNTPGEQWAMEIYFDVNGEARVDAGVYAACVFPFDFDTWMNFEIIVDLDNDLGELWFNGTQLHTWQWTLTSWGIGLLSLGGLNLWAWDNGGGPALAFYDDIHFSIIYPEPSDELTGYNVYLDDMTTPIAVNIPYLEYLLTGLNYNQIYTVGVSAVYDDPGESIIITITFWMPAGFYPPENLVATLYDYNDVHLEWEPPGWTGGLLAHHSGYDNNGIGAGLTEWYCAARFDAADLADYYGSDLTAINVHIRSTYFTYVGIKVWEGGTMGNPGTEIYNEEITTSVLIEDWTNHVLTAPITLVEGNEYWLGYEIHMFGECPCSVDAGPAVPEKGDWMYMYLLGWQEISVAFGLDYNWCIEGVVGGGDGILRTTHAPNNQVRTPQLRNMISSGTPEVLSVHPRTKRIENNRESRMLLGYKVYCNGVEIVEIFDPNELTYDDMALNGGTYEYWVTAIYDYGESDPSNAEEVIIILYAPQNLTAMVQGMNNVFLFWDAPATRDLDFYNVYRDSIQIASVTSTFYLDEGLAAGNYVYNVTALYCGGWESEFSNDATTGNLDIGDTPIPVVTELIGSYPNPFNPETTIKFTTENTEENTELIICNIKGQKVKTLINTIIPNGFHRIVWDGKDENSKSVSSGIYFYKMKTGKYVSTKRMILMK